MTRTTTTTVTVTTTLVHFRPGCFHRSGTIVPLGGNANFHLRSSERARGPTDATVAYSATFYLKSHKCDSISHGHSGRLFKIVRPRICNFRSRLSKYALTLHFACARYARCLTQLSLYNIAKKKNSPIPICIITSNLIIFYNYIESNSTIYAI